jgi:hypothetical protein
MTLHCAHSQIPWTPLSVYGTAAMWKSSGSKRNQHNYDSFEVQSLVLIELCFFFSFQRIGKTHVALYNIFRRACDHSIFRLPFKY